MLVSQRGWALVVHAIKPSTGKAYKMGWDRNLFSFGLKISQRQSTALTAWSAHPRSHLPVVLGGTVSHQVHPGESCGSQRGCAKSQGQSWDSDLTRVTPSFPPALSKPFVSILGLSIASSALTEELYISSQQFPNRKEIQACSFNRQDLIYIIKEDIYNRVRWFKRQPKSFS